MLNTGIRQTLCAVSRANADCIFFFNGERAGKMQKKSCSKGDEEEIILQQSITTEVMEW